MARDPGCTIYIGNLDDKVTERVLYEILIQVGRVVDLYIPRDKETNKHKGYAFAEYETEEIAAYAVKLFSGLVRLHNKTVKFAALGILEPMGCLSCPVDFCCHSLSWKINSCGYFYLEQMSGQDKPAQNTGTPVTPKMNPVPLPKPYPVNGHDRYTSRGSDLTLIDCRASAGNHSISLAYPQASSGGLVNRGLSSENFDASSGGLINRGLSNSNFEYSRRVLGAMVDNVSRQGASHRIAYPSY